MRWYWWLLFRSQGVDRGFLQAKWHQCRCGLKCSCGEESLEATAHQRWVFYLVLTVTEASDPCERTILRFALQPAMPLLYGSVRSFACVLASLVRGCVSGGIPPATKWLWDEILIMGLSYEHLLMGCANPMSTCSWACYTSMVHLDEW